MKHTQKQAHAWYHKLQHSWVFNALILPILISFICGLIIQWVR